MMRSSRSTQPHQCHSWLCCIPKHAALTVVLTFSWFLDKQCLSYSALLPAEKIGLFIGAEHIGEPCARPKCQTALWSCPLGTRVAAGVCSLSFTSHSCLWIWVKAGIRVILLRQALPSTLMRILQKSPTACVFRTELYLLRNQRLGGG